MAKKIIALLCAVLLLLSLCAACAVQGEFSKQKRINVITREDGSGTRQAFIELFGVEEKGEDGTRRDNTTKDAVTAKQTDIMITNVMNDPYAVGYISVGSMSDSVKALSIEGVEPSRINVLSGAYEIVRPFYLATKGEASALAQDFIDFILSGLGQAIVADSGYIPVMEAPVEYQNEAPPAGRLVVAGSSSVTPVMEKLRTAYREANPAAVIEIQMSDSSGGLLAAMEDTCDIAMSSRDLKESEQAVLLSVKIASDAIAVIVNTSNPLEDLARGQVKDIFTGAALKWNEVILTEEAE
ncbi:MAG: substrate-binding domain-containing protein [Oscillospiraceae bacterium]|nr:substrate-binding domain-containing protein [Oscillospiraceae bacterium]